RFPEGVHALSGSDAPHSTLAQLCPHQGDEMALLFGLPCGKTVVTEQLPAGPAKTNVALRCAAHQVSPFWQALRPKINQLRVLAPCQFGHRHCFKEIQLVGMCCRESFAARSAIQKLLKA